MEARTVVTTAQGGEGPGQRGVQEGRGRTPPSASLTGAWAGRGLLGAPRVPAATLARAVPVEQAGAARAGLRRVRRWWQGPAPRRPARRPPPAGGGPPGVAWSRPGAGPGAGGRAGRAGRGAGLPSPWPQGRVRGTTRARRRQLRAGPGAGRWTRVAARGFPSARRLAQGRQGGTDGSGRRRWRAGVTGAGGAALGAAPWRGTLVAGQRPAAARAVGAPRWAWRLVVPPAVATPPPPQPPPGTVCAQASRAEAQAQPRRPQPGRQTSPPRATAPRSAPSWGVCTTAPRRTQAGGE